MEKMLMLIYNKAFGSRILDDIEKCGITCFTTIPVVYGRGSTGGPRMGTHVWPGENEMMLIVTDREKVDSVMGKVKALRKEKGGKGVKAFVMSIEDKI